MHEAPPLPPALLLMGPTASGKTRLAVELAAALDGEVISVDSALVYRGLDIGTAKPTLEERRGIPHHLIDLLDPAESYSTGRFREDALALIAAINARGRLPILAGGTMLYFNALRQGLAALPAADPELRRQLDAAAASRGWPALHQELAAVDPAAAARIHPHDPQRIQRALEVYHLTGVPLTQLCQDAPSAPLPFRPVPLILAPADRELLHRRIRARFLDMLAGGFLDEVRTLRARVDLHPELPSLRAVGYRQAWAHLAGEFDRDTLVERAVIATRQFAKRQYTWLRRETTAPRYLGDEPRLFDVILNDMRERLAKPR